MLGLIGRTRQVLVFVLRLATTLLARTEVVDMRTIGSRVAVILVCSPCMTLKLSTLGRPMLRTSVLTCLSLTSVRLLLLALVLRTVQLRSLRCWCKVQWAVMPLLMTNKWTLCPTGGSYRNG